MTDAKYTMFRNNICSAAASSIYNEWDDTLIDCLSSSERTIYYDSNIAFTNGDRSIVSGTDGDGSILAVPDLYGTLKGLNTRITGVTNTINTIQAGNVSTADARLYVTAAANEYIISPGSGEYNDTTKSIATEDELHPISLQGSSDTSSTSKFTVNGDDFLFTVNNETLSLTNLLAMIEELRARTDFIKTNVARTTIDLNNGYSLSENKIE